jgi:hypothetical protein
MSSVVIAVLPILGLNKEKIRGNQEAVLPHNQEAVRGFIGKLPHNSGRTLTYSRKGSHKFQGSLT